MLKTLRSALIAGTGAGLTYLLSHVTDTGLPTVALPVVTAGLSVLVDLLRRLGKGALENQTR